MEDEDFRKLLIAAGISAGMTPQGAIETADHTIALLMVDMWESENDE